ncbi:MAG: transglutaminase family protein [Tepidisphaeraceae bacterium]
MLIRLTHATELKYSDMISESVMEIRVAPRQETYQHRLSFDLAIGPPTSVSSYFDWLGNTVHHFTINGFHDQLRIVATSVLDVNRTMFHYLDMPDVWPLPKLEDYTLYDYLKPSGPIVDVPALHEVIKELNVKEGMPLGELSDRMLTLIAEKFEYVKGITSAASPITDVLEHRKGVCQDFTHLFIAMARVLGIPARYVSGLVHPLDREIRGALQTHAWCELLFPSHGWMALDPTNRQQAGSNFVTVAVGRDYRDVPPNRGTWRGSAKESINVAVHSELLDIVPEELAAERVSALNTVATYGGWSRDRRAHASDLQTAQQQQQQ